MDGYNSLKKNCGIVRGKLEILGKLARGLPAFRCFPIDFATFYTPHERAFWSDGGDHAEGFYLLNTPRYFPILSWQREIVDK